MKKYTELLTMLTVLAFSAVICYINMEYCFITDNANTYQVYLWFEFCFNSLACLGASLLLVLGAQKKSLKGEDDAKPAATIAVMLIIIAMLYPIDNFSTVYMIAKETIIVFGIAAWYAAEKISSIAAVKISCITKAYVSLLVFAVISALNPVMYLFQNDSVVISSVSIAVLALACLLPARPQKGKYGLVKLIFCLAMYGVCVVFWVVIGNMLYYNFVLYAIPPVLLTLLMVAYVTDYAGKAKPEQIAENQ